MITAGERCTSDLFSGFSGRKGPNSVGKISTVGSFDSAPPSVLTRDRSVRRSAQDDVFVGVVTKNIPNTLALQDAVLGWDSWDDRKLPRAMHL
jgi:hypothetical protein